MTTLPDSPRRDPLVRWHRRLPPAPVVRDVDPTTRGMAVNPHPEIAIVLRRAERARTVFLRSCFRSLGRRGGRWCRGFVRPFVSAFRSEVECQAEIQRD
jgi:hypothetical protein